MPARCTIAPRLVAAAAVTAVLVASGCGRPPPPSVVTERTAAPLVEEWVVTAASPILAPGPAWDPEETWAEGLEGSTLRQVVHSSLGGDAARVTISNRAGTEPLVVGAAALGVAERAAGSGAALDEAVALAFGGRGEVTVAPGEEIVSDAVDLAVPADHDLAVDLFLAGPTGAPNGARFGGQTSWRGDGDRVGDVGGAGFTDSRTGLAYVAAVEVRAPEPEGAVVVLGDSKSDGGLAVPPDSEGRWPEVLHARFVADGRLGVGVANVSYMGATLLPADDPTSGLGRFDADVLSRSGVRAVIVALGTNDLLFRTTDEIVAGLAALIERGHAAGIRVVGATIPPFAGTRAAGACSDTEPPGMRREGTRLEVNQHVRGTDGVAPLGFDAVIDLDEVLRDPEDPSRIACRYSIFGLSHPGSAGHAAMAAAVDLDSLLR